ncbi:hypothetical protein A6R68_12220, partial [Neotoma lepida]
AAFNSGKVDSDLFIDFYYMVYVLHYDSIHSRTYGSVKAENRRLVMNGKAISIFQE